LYGDRDPLTAVACSPDGHLVAAAEGKEIAHLWDLRTRERTTFELHASLGIDLAFSADGRYLLAAGFGLMGHPIAVIDTAKKKPPKIGLEAYALADRVAPHPNPDLAVIRRAAAPPNRVDVVRLPSGETLRSVEFPIGLNAQFGYMNGPLAVSRDGRRAAAGGPRVVVCDLSNLATGVSISRESRSIAFAPAGNRLYVGTHHGTVSLHDADTGRELASGVLGKTALERDYGPALAVDPNGTAVYAAGFRGSLRVLRPETLDTRATFDWHLGQVNGLAVSADGSRLFSAGADGCVKVWPVRELLRGV
jgi:WD40 repeat protein